VLGTLWHPVGIPCVWSLRRWTRDNVWESEDGPSRISLPYREYYWDNGMCWLDARRFAVAGIGDDAERMIDGVTIYELDEMGALVDAHAFAGPSGEVFGDGDRLYSADAEGLRVWDVTDGARVQEIAGFTPTRQHVGGRELVAVEGGALVRLRY
jgi:hypothetical protein